MKSSFPLITSCVIFVTLDLIAVILSTLPLGIPGRLNLGYLVSVNSREGFWILIVYGPYPGGGGLFRPLHGDLAAGVGGVQVSARANGNLVSGAWRLIVMSPVLSLVTIPLMSSLQLL